MLSTPHHLDKSTSYSQGYPTYLPVPVPAIPQGHPPRPPLPLVVSSFWPPWVVRRVLDDTLRGLVYLHSHDPPIIHRGRRLHVIWDCDKWILMICEMRWCVSCNDAHSAMNFNARIHAYMLPLFLTDININSPNTSIPTLLFHLSPLCHLLSILSSPLSPLSSLPTSSQIWNRQIFCLTTASTSR